MASTLSSAKTIRHLAGFTPVLLAVVLLSLPAAADFETEETGARRSRRCGPCIRRRGRQRCSRPPEGSRARTRPSLPRCAPVRARRSSWLGASIPVVARRRPEDQKARRAGWRGKPADRASARKTARGFGAGVPPLATLSNAPVRPASESSSVKTSLSSTSFSKPAKKLRDRSPSRSTVPEPAQDAGRNQAPAVSTAYAIGWVRERNEISVIGESAALRDDCGSAACGSIYRYPSWRRRSFSASLRARSGACSDSEAMIPASRSRSSATTAGCSAARSCASPCGAVTS